MVADLLQMKKALRRADQAGDTAGAQRLVAAIRREEQSMTHQPSAYRQEQTVPTWEGALRSGFQGATFGFGDEIVAGGAAALQPLFTPDDGSTIGQRYDRYLEGERGKLESFGESNPYTAFPAEMAGAIPSALLGMGAAGGASALGTMARGAGIGAGEGAAYGFGSGEGEGRVAEALQGGAIGAPMGAAAPYAGEAVRRVGEALSAPVQGALSMGNGSRAARYVGRTMKRSGKTLDELEGSLSAAARDGQPEFVLADAMGKRGQRALSGVARHPSDTQNEIVDFLENRQAGQGERLSSFLAEGFDASDTAAQRQAKLRTARKTAADAEYKAATDGAGPVNLNDALASIDEALGRDPILGETALSKGEIGSRLKALRDKMEKDGEQAIDFRNVLGIKSDLYETLRRNPNRELQAVYGDLDRALENASDGYRAANDNYRKASDAIDAIEAGQSAARPRSRSADVADTYGGLSPEEQASFSAGYGDSVIGKIEATAPGSDASRPLTTPKVGSDIETIARNPAQTKDRIQREKAMFETRRQATGGSQTADNLADMQETGGANAVGLAVDAGATGGVVTVAKALARSAGKAAVGMNDETIREISRALLSRDPTAALQPALRQAAKDKSTARVIEALIRGGTIRAQ